MMTDARWDKIGALFEQVQSVPPEERDAVLEERCDDEAMRQEVASLLSTHQEAAGFFDSFAEAVVAPALDELPPAERQRAAGSDPLGLEREQVACYAVEEHLGGGGMGVVYRARDPQLDRTVALKFLPPHLVAHPEAEERFVREARAAAALGHSNIATIHEIGDMGNGRRFIAMAYYEGKTLKEKLNREESLPIEEAVGYAEQIGEALAGAHEAGIVHRDVKPANAMVTETGTVKLLDFGLAKAADRSRLTEPGRRLGTAAYMSPEQAKGEAVDARTDLWALGVVLYEMLAGERPFRGARETAVVYAILHGEPDPVSTHREEISSALGRVVGRLLAKDPAARYPAAEDLLEDLRAVRRGDESVSPDTEATGAERTSAHSIAVLPFETLGRQEPTTLTEGIHGDVLTRLSNVSDLQVISRTSVRRYRNTEKAIPQIGGELEVRWVLEGEVQEAASQFQINTRLVNVREDRQVWARDHRGALTAENVFEVQGEITKKIVDALAARLTPEEQERVEQRPTENLDAYRLCMQGRTHLDERTEDGIRRAFDCFQRAIDQDSEYALAWAGLTDALSLFAFYGFAPPDDAPDPMEAAQRAVDLDPELGEARTSLGIQHAIRHEGPAALGELTRAVEQTPSYAEAHIWLGWVQLCLGRPEKGLASAKQAVELNPLGPAFRVYLAEHYLANDKRDDALREARRAREIQPEYGLTHFMEGLALHHQGRFVAAASSLQRAQSLVPSQGTPEHTETQAVLAVTYAVSDDERRARKLLHQIDETTAPFSAGLVLAALDDADAAFEAFNRVGDWGSFETEHLRYFFPDVLGSLREDPRYDELVRTVNRSWGLKPDGTIPEQADMSQ